MADELSGIFDNLDPRDFLLETSAVDEQTGAFKGVVAFNLSVDDHVRQLKVQFATSAGHMNPIGVLSNETTQRTFTPQQDENLGQFLERLKREARLMGARWLFLAKKNVFTSYTPEHDEPDDLPDIASEDAAELLASRGATQQYGILWYAERREEEDTQQRQGALTISSAGDKIVGSIEGDERQSLKVFSIILDAVT